ncbi:hypothetical protein FGO68_gene5105 [Halteria grandinella]|uniref:Uncharacterized protein n=1 Tax=Halteria grandinella TaxID=5974 RepID=A0A8J8T3E1_HALGN|nr:hypothetical protein FGO68_gene5105 [Halteria grandinella]
MPAYNLRICSTAQPHICRKRVEISTFVPKLIYLPTVKDVTFIVQLLLGSELGLGFFLQVDWRLSLFLRHLKKSRIFRNSWWLYRHWLWLNYFQLLNNLYCFQIFQQFMQLIQTWLYCITERHSFQCLFDLILQIYISLKYALLSRCVVSINLVKYLPIFIVCVLKSFDEVSWVHLGRQRRLIGQLLLVLKDFSYQRTVFHIQNLELLVFLEVQFWIRYRELNILGIDICLTFILIHTNRHFDSLLRESYSNNNLWIWLLNQLMGQDYWLLQGVKS